MLAVLGTVKVKGVHVHGNNMSTIYCSTTYVDISTMYRHIRLLASGSESFSWHDFSIYIIYIYIYICLYVAIP